MNDKQKNTKLMKEYDKVCEKLDYLNGQAFQLEKEIGFLANKHFK